MKIEQINLYHLAIPFIHPFKFSNGELFSHDCWIVEVKSEGLTAWGECPVFPQPCYTYETLYTAYHILKDYLIPCVVGKNITSAKQIRDLFTPIRGHNMAKSTLDCAIWDLFAQAQNLLLWELFGGVRQRVKVGVSVSLSSDIDRLLLQVEEYVDQGYQRIKLKISPHSHFAPLQAIRNRYPNLMLMADANSAFTLEDIPLFQQLDSLNLLMIEQPLAYDDLLDHGYLQSLIQTPLCLDESINTIHDTRSAIALKSAPIINLKVSRVGGISNLLDIHHLCQEAGIKLWCGGMLESGIGRATNLHIASLPNFVLPADISATNRYFHQDIIQETFTLNQEDSTLDVPSGKGLGVTINPEIFVKFLQSKEVFYPN